MKLGKSYALVRTSSSFQLFLLDRLRLESAEAEQGFGLLEDFNENEVGDAVELWLESHQRELKDFVDLDPHPGSRG